MGKTQSGALWLDPEKYHHMIFTNIGEMWTIEMLKMFITSHLSPYG